MTAVRRPVHVVYGGAHLFKAATARRMGDLALAAMRDHAPDPATFARAIGVPASIASAVHARVLAKLEREPVEDYRLDFEDGYGVRPDEEEDGHAVSAAEEVAKGHAAGTLPPFIGVRIKPLADGLEGRALRTLGLFVSTLCARTKGALPPKFVVTLPKVDAPAQVEAIADALDALEGEQGIAPGAIGLELMIELPRAVIGADGRFAIPALIDAGRPRCVALHFGTYDYTASLGVSASHQTMGHPACDFALSAMQVCTAGTDVAMSDGATTVMPIGPHRATGGAPLADAERAENTRAVHAAWAVMADNVRRSLARGIYQGWDLHPAQLPVRYATTFAFFLSDLDAMAARLRNFKAAAARATRVNERFDDAATGHGLLNFFARAIACGAVSEEDAARLVGDPAQRG